MRLPERIIALTTATATVVVVAAAVFASNGEPTDPTASSGSSDSSAHGGAPGEPVIHVPVVRAGTLVGPRTHTPPLPASALARLDIPPTALLAYQRAVRVMNLADHSCRLPWTLLAAIGRIESDHGRYDGAQLEPDGVSSPTIRGVALDGRGGVARIPDTDGGRLDGDPVWDHAVGPMQLLPSTWAVVAVDGDGDGIRNPDDLDDASLAAAVFLCSGHGDLSTLQGMRAAVHRYNPSAGYVDEVLAVERAYRTGDYTLLGQPARVGPVQVVVNPPSTQQSTGAGSGSSTPPSGSPSDAATGSSQGKAIRADGGPGRSNDPQVQQSRQPAPSKAAVQGAGRHPGVPAKPTSTPARKAAGPAPRTPASPPSTPPTSTQDPPSTWGDPTDPPTSGASDPGSPYPGSPDPSTPDPSSPDASDASATTVDLTGVLDHCGPETDGLCLDGTALDVGDPAYLAAPATTDLDGDGTVETNGEELEGLVGTQVDLQVLSGSDPALVVAVNGTRYRPAP